MEAEVARKIRQHARGSVAALQSAGLKQAANGFCGVAVLGDDGFE